MPLRSKSRGCTKEFRGSTHTLCEYTYYLVLHMTSYLIYQSTAVRTVCPSTMSAKYIRFGPTYPIPNAFTYDSTLIKWFTINSKPYYFISNWYGHIALDDVFTLISLKYLYNKECCYLFHLTILYSYNIKWCNKLV